MWDGIQLFQWNSDCSLKAKSQRSLYSLLCCLSPATEDELRRRWVAITRAVFSVVHQLMDKNRLSEFGVSLYPQILSICIYNPATDTDFTVFDSLYTFSDDRMHPKVLGVGFRAPLATWTSTLIPIPSRTSAFWDQISIWRQWSGLNWGYNFGRLMKAKINTYDLLLGEDCELTGQLNIDYASGKLFNTSMFSCNPLDIPNLQQLLNQSFDSI